MVPIRKRLGFALETPVIQAPLGGGRINTPELCAAVSNAGGLGSLAAAYLSPDAITKTIARVRELTARPFAVNLFAPAKVEPPQGNLDAQLDLLRPIHERLGLDPPSLPEDPAESFEAQFEAILAARPAILSFALGMLPADAIDRLHRQDTYVMGTATSVAEAKMLEAAGVDALVAQGSEAGGHRSSFTPIAPSAQIGTMALVPQVVDAVRLPVIASGGIMDGRGIVAALALGASAVQMGTAFLTCAESGAPAAHIDAILHASDDGTVLTRAFSGRWARGIRNSFVEASEQTGAEPITFPWQNALTRAMRSAAAQRGDTGFLSLWAGQGAPMARRIPAAELMANLRQEIADTLQALTSP